MNLEKFSLYAVFVQIENYSGFNLTLPFDDVVCGYNKERGDKVMDELSPVWISMYIVYPPVLPAVLGVAPQHGAAAVPQHRRPGIPHLRQSVLATLQPRLQDSPLQFYINAIIIYNIFLVQKCQQSLSHLLKNLS